jgi:hypothetical protein
MNIIEKLKTLIHSQQQKFITHHPANFEFRITRKRKGILQELRWSKEHGKAVGIYSSILGEGMFVTGIEDIYEWDKDTIIVLKPYDLGGLVLQRNYLSLSEIKGICPFNFIYRHPLINKDQLEEIS